MSHQTNKLDPALEFVLLFRVGQRQLRFARRRRRTNILATLDRRFTASSDGRDKRRRARASQSLASRSTSDLWRHSSSSSSFNPDRVVLSLSLDHQQICHCCRLQAAGKSHCARAATSYNMATLRSVVSIGRIPTVALTQLITQTLRSSN